MRRTVLQVITVVGLAAMLRIGVFQLDSLNCRTQFRQYEFACEMGFYLLPILIAAILLSVAIPYFFLAYSRDRIALWGTLLLMPVVANALLRVVDFAVLGCRGDDYDANVLCVVLFAQVFFLSAPTLAGIIFLWAKGWRLLFFQEEIGGLVPSGKRLGEMRGG